MGTSAARQVDEAEKEVECATEEERQKNEETIVELCDCVIDLTSAFYNVCGKEMRMPGRSRGQVARIRQIAMYVAHTVLDMSMAEVGRGFGRDRTTVLHAVHLIEDLRDDPTFDAILARTEHLAKTVMRGRKVWSLR
ncbi:chromosomal replication initiator DnaA [Tianweitania sp. BSSL-BM11]|uniref:Chromosomal replication initiator DnaA n=1 Tax=Tianweitania aestuarii TaxID=2814886 RepID=A0ABS5RUB0_9HYPH|nr:chromosomal replication initiator DnaA [Tianweitania aestuarii]